MTYDQWHELTEAQRQAVRDLANRQRGESNGAGYENDLEEMIRQAEAPCGPIYPYVGIPNWHGMFIGIEADGHTHS